LAWDLDEAPDQRHVKQRRKIANDFNPELDIINIGKPHAYQTDNVVESIKIEKLLKLVKPTFHFIADKNTNEEIIRFAEKNNLDLLMVLAKQRNFFESLIHNSHTKQLVLQSDYPVMALH